MPGNNSYLFPPKDREEKIQSMLRNFHTKKQSHHQDSTKSHDQQVCSWRVQGCSEGWMEPVLPGGQHKILRQTSLSLTGTECSSGDVATLENFLSKFLSGEQDNPEALSSGED